MSFLRQNVYVFNTTLCAESWNAVMMMNDNDDDGKEADV